MLRERPRPAAIRDSPRAHRYVLVTVCLGAFMGQLDASIVTLALPRIGASLHSSSSIVEWVSLSYLLVLAATILFVGRLADRFGRKLLYGYGFAVFTLGSLACGLAPNLDVLIAARAAQGLGAAMLQANSLALIAEAIPSGRLGRAVGIQGAAQASGLAFGPAVGGVLLATGGWRLIFLVNLPVGAIGLVLAWFLLPRSRTLARAGDRALRALPVRRIAGPLAAGLVSYMALFGALYVVPYFLSAHHSDVTQAGLQLAALPVALGVVAPLAGRLSDRLGSRRVAVGGLSLAAIGMLVLGTFPDGPGLPLGLALAGAGLGAFTPANNAKIMGAAPSALTGVIAAAANLTRALGTALGVALAGLIYTSATPGSGATATAGVAAARGLIDTAALLAASLVVVASLMVIRRPRQA